MNKCELKLRPIFCGDIMIIDTPIKKPLSEDYVTTEIDVDICSGSRHYYYQIDGHAKVLGYLPGETIFIPNSNTTIWFFPN